MALLSVTHLSHQFMDKQLYMDAELVLNPHDRMGIIGQNGVGKSTLIHIITGQLIPDEGRVDWQKRVRYGYLDQYAKLSPGVTINGFLHSAFADLYADEKRMNDYYTDYASNGDADVLAKAGTIQEELEAADFYNIDTRVDQVATGLGLAELGADRDVTKLSGGQRSKLILAKLLLSQPDVLLLDEPTNFLDKDHIDWLSNFLQAFNGAYIVVSHDYDFLDQVTNVICDVEFGKITRYTGNLKQALKLRDLAHESYMREFNKQQEKINKAEAYIRKYKAGSRSKSARSREKQLAHVDRLTPPGNTKRPVLDFPYVDTASEILVTVSDLLIGYDQPLLKEPLNFSVGRGEVVVFAGFNGVGKTTLLRTILGELPALGGEVDKSSTMIPGYYDQELHWQAPLASPLQYLQGIFTKAQPRTLRQALARTGLTAQQAMSPIHELSGGEQSKVKLAKLLLTPSNLLLLDEPTNHLDEATKDALRTAIQAFSGGVILVTHEEGFYDDSWVDKVLDIASLRK